MADTKKDTKGVAIDFAPVLKKLSEASFANLKALVATEDKRRGEQDAATKRAEEDKLSAMSAQEFARHLDESLSSKKKSKS